MALLNIGSIIPGSRGRARRVLIGAAATFVLVASAFGRDGPAEATPGAPPAAIAPLAAGSDALPLGGTIAGPRPAGDEAFIGNETKAERRPGGVGVGQVAGALGFVLALILVVFKAIRGGARARGGLMAAAGPGGRAPSGVLSVLGRYPLARGQSLLLLRLDRRVLLVAQTGGTRAGPSLATLTEITDPEEVASIAAKCEEARPGAGKFRAELERYEDEHREADGASAVSSMRDRLAAWRRAEPGGSPA